MHLTTLLTGKLLRYFYLIAFFMSLTTFPIRGKYYSHLKNEDFFHIKHVSTLKKILRFLLLALPSKCHSRN